MLDLVFGAYGEASDGMKKLLGQIVETRVSSHARHREVLVGEAALVGEGQGQAGRREEEKAKEWARREEENARPEREAHWLERIAGRNLFRRGDFPHLISTSKCLCFV